MKFLRKLIKWLLILVVAGFVGCQIYIPFENRKLIRNYLNLTELPSVSSTTCTDYGFSDILVKCYFEINPEDFPELTKGRIWTRSPGTDGCAQGPKTGESFTVIEILSADLNDEKKKGSIHFCYGKEMNQALIHFYLE